MAGGGSSRWCTWAAVVVVAGASLGCTHLRSLDLPLARAAGARILRDGHVPRHNVFSWVHRDHPYVNDKWGFMALVASAENLTGVRGLVALKVLLAAAMGWLLWSIVPRKLPAASRAGCALTGLAVLAYRLALRPEWISYLGTALTLLLVLRARERRARPWEGFLLVPLVPVWAASHLYWFLGPAILCVDGLLGRRPRHLVAAVLAVPAAAVSPFGWRNLGHVGGILGGLGPLQPGIMELRTPFLEGPWSWHHVAALGLLAPALASFGTALRHRDGSRAGLLACCIVAGLSVDRNLALLGFTAPLAVWSSGAPVGGRAWRWAGLAVVPALVLPVTGPTALAGGRTVGFGVPPGLFPEELAASLPPRDAARYVNDLSIGSYLVLARGEAFIDGNTSGYPPGFFARYRSWLRGELTIRAMDRLYEHQGYLLRHGGRHLVNVLAALFLDGRYVPVRHDVVATLFAERPAGEETARTWRLWFRAVRGPWDADLRAGKVLAARLADRLGPYGPDEVLRMVLAELRRRPYARQLYHLAARCARLMQQPAAARRLRRLWDRLPAAP